SSHHIARCLAQGVPLLYVETPGLRRPRATARDLRKLWRKLRLAFQPPRPIGETLWHMTLPQIPFRRLPGVRALNWRIGGGLVRRAMRHAGIQHPVLWFAVPHPGALAGRLSERFVVYYCIDDYAALPSIDSQRIALMDEDLTRRADQVFVSSAPLLEKKRAV